MTVIEEDIAHDQNTQPDDAMGKKARKPPTEEVVDRIDSREVDEVARTTLDHGNVSGTRFVHSGEYSNGGRTATNDCNLFANVIEVFWPELRMNDLA